MNLYIVNDIANTRETSVKISLQSVILKPIALPLAIPTCIVSLRSFIFICFVPIQVGFKLSYVLYFRFIMSFH